MVNVEASYLCVTVQLGDGQPHGWLVEMTCRHQSCQLWVRDYVALGTWSLIVKFLLPLVF